QAGEGSRSEGERPALGGDVMSGLVKRQNPQPRRPAPGLERRPATPRANARELALKSHARQLRREGLDRRAAEVMLAAGLSHPIAPLHGGPVAKDTQTTPAPGANPAP